MSTDRTDPSAAPCEAAAQKLYDNSPTMTPPPAQSRDRAPLPERRGEFYSWTQTSETIKQRGPELAAQAGFDRQAQHALDDKYRRLAKETGLSDGVLAPIAAGELDSIAAGARVSEDPDGDELALAQQIAREQCTAP